MNNISEVYKQKEVLEAMRENMQHEGVLQLGNFLNEEENKTLIKQILKESFILDYKALEHSRNTLPLSKITNYEVLSFFEFFRSKNFIEYIEDIVESELQIETFKICLYRHKDFILLHDKQERSDSLDIIFDLTQTWNEAAGGILTYVNQEEEIFYLSPAYNSLTILFRNEEYMRYLKYINHLAEKDIILRIEISMRFVETEL